jgi:NAD(P)H-dependent FMN reductase
MAKIKIITGSNRPGRFNPQPVAWIKSIAETVPGIEVEVLDLVEINLPFLDETMPPMMGQYEHAHTKAWAAKIGEADGFVFVTPEYNHAYPAVLKNAIDYLFAEWNYKPVAFVSYGAIAGGARAVEQLRTLASVLNMFALKEQVAIANYWGGLNESGEYQFTEDQAKVATEMLGKLAFWAEEMKTSRAKLV